MTKTVELLEAVGIFAELPRNDVERMAEGVVEVELAEAEVLFAEGDPGAHAYVICSGELEIVKETEGREVLLAVRVPGEVIGEMALLDAKPRSATVRAKSAAELLSIPKERFDELLATSPTAARALFGVLLDRWRETEVRLRQSERMAQLGTLTAGLAHELNNPAAAVKRSTDQLGAAMEGYAEALAVLRGFGVDVESDQQIDSLIRGERGTEPLGALERSDQEVAIEDRLHDLGVSAPWEVAPALVDAGLCADDIDDVAARHGDAAASVLAAIAAGNVAFSLLREVQEGASRLSAIVGALKSYSYLDQAPIQEVEVTSGIDDTLLILKHKLGDIRVEREYSPDTPPIFAFGSELNQVWTNIIDNAAHALVSAEVDDPQITISVAPDDNGGVVVRIADNGPGIPDDVQSRVFDAFFTTKAPGEGTGLGLDISYGIVVHKHGGEISFESAPGSTVFTVELPSGKRPDSDDSENG